jgi:CRISPR-associated endonuclease Cas1
MRETTSLAASGRSGLTGAVLTLHGYGIRVSVERGHLLIQDGIADERRTLRLSRVSPGLRRLVVHGRAGTVSLEAQRWLHDVGIAYVHLDGHGEVLAIGTPRALDDVRVLRGQAFAPFNGVGVTVARELLTAKLNGQARIAARMKSAGALATLREALALLPDAHTVEDLRFIESRGAAAYWDAWTGLPIHFVPRDRSRVPAHWLTYDTRRSALAPSPRKATNPVNAVLNYLYAILEAEASIAIRSVGLDPRLAVLHADSSRRESFACDVMEAVRPHVDAYVLDLFAKRTFLRTEFFEGRDGSCRLMPSLTSSLATTGLRWAKLLGPFAERAAALFAGSGQPTPYANETPPRQPSIAFRTPLTQSNRARRHKDKTSAIGARCRGCGVDLGTLARSHCAECRPASSVASAELGRVKLTQLRDAGRDARSAVSVRKARRQSTAKMNREIAAWEADNPMPTDATQYERDIAPLLQELDARTVADATGLSMIYCRQIRAGTRVPHPRHWEALSTLGQNRGITIPAHWDTAFYLKSILPRLAEVPVHVIADGTGLSVPYCKRIRRGVQMPKRIHWAHLVETMDRLRK